MYTAKTTFSVSAAHRLKLDYQSPCQHLHGHNWKITVTCQAEQLNKNGMVVDFRYIKHQVHDVLDHSVINDYFDEHQGGLNPTAENMAHWICELIGPACKRVEVQETEGNVAIYER